MRRLIGPVLGLALMAAAAGPALAAKNTSAVLSACNWTLGTPAVHVQVDWAGYHPDTLTVVSWQSGSSAVTQFPTARTVEWKFGTAAWETDYATWSNAGVTFSPGTMVAVDLWFHGKLLTETNAVDAGVLADC